MADYRLGELATDLPCIYGLGKSFRQQDGAEVPAGTRVIGRFDGDGWHKFAFKDPSGRILTYAVRSASILDTALGLDGAPTPKAQALAEIRRLMRLHGIGREDIPEEAV